MTKYKNLFLPDGYDIKVVNNFKDIEAIRTTWESMQWHPNADIDYYLTVVNSHDEILQPYILTLYKNGTPVAMLIGRIENRRIEIKIGYKALLKPVAQSITINYGGILGNTDNSNATILINYLLIVMKQEKYDVAFFNSLPTDFSIYKYAKTMPGFLCRNHVSVPTIHWRMTVPDNMDSFFKNLNYKFRKNLRRSIRKIDKEYHDCIGFRCFKTRHEAEQFIEDAEKVAKQTYQRGLGVGLIDNMQNRDLIMLAAEKGWLRSYILYINNKPVSFEQILLYGDTLFCEHAGYDPAYKDVEPGTNIFIKIIEEVCSETFIKYIDFGFGDARYKKNFCDEKRQEESLYIFAPTVKGVVLNLIITSFSIFSKCTERIFNKFNLTEKIKRLWRNHLIRNKK